MRYLYYDLMKLIYIMNELFDVYFAMCVLLDVFSFLKKRMRKERY